jgi:hypothetical protein
MSRSTICYGAAIDVIIIMPVPNTRFRYDRLPPNQQPNPQHINVHSILIKSKSDAEETHYQSCLSFFFLSLGNRQATSNKQQRRLRERMRPMGRRRIIYHSYMTMTTSNLFSRVYQPPTLLRWINQLRRWWTRHMAPQHDAWCSGVCAWSWSILRFRVRIPTLQLGTRSGWPVNL